MKALIERNQNTDKKISSPNLKSGTNWQHPQFLIQKTLQAATSREKESHQ